MQQKGVIYLFILFLVIALVAGVYLVQQRTNFLPKAGGGIVENAYAVEAVILIPSDWREKISEEQLNNYKKNAYETLTYVRNWYSDKLNGYTFTLRNSSIDVIYAQRPLEYEKQTIDPRTMYDLFQKVDGFNEVKVDDKTVEVVWLIGTGTEDVTAVASTFYVIMNENSLSSFDEEKNKNESLGTLAHELGHTFGLVSAGWAKVHPCAELLEDDCLPGAPRPLPKFEDMKNDVMSNGGVYQFPNTGFSNSIHNPEIWKLFQSPFINPNHDSIPPEIVVPENSRE